MRKFITLISLLLMATIAIGQETSDRVFELNPTSIYGVFAGTLFVFASACVVFFGWLFRKLFNSWADYKSGRLEGDAQRTDILTKLLAETERTNIKVDELITLQTEQGRQLAHIDGKVGEIEKDLDEVKGKVSDLEGQIKNLRG